MYIFARGKGFFVLLKFFQKSRTKGETKVLFQREPPPPKLATACIIQVYRAIFWILERKSQFRCLPSSTSYQTIFFQSIFYVNVDRIFPLQDPSLQAATCLILLYIYRARISSQFSCWILTEIQFRRTRSFRLVGEVSWFLATWGGPILPPPCQT